MIFKQKREMEEVENEVYEKEGFTEFFVVDWRAKYQNDSVIKQELEKIASLYEEVFDRQNPRIEHLVCKDLPETLTEEMYLKIYRKQMAVFRHKVYLIMKESGMSRDPQVMEA